MALLVVPSVSSVSVSPIPLSYPFAPGKQLIFTSNRRYSRRTDVLARRGGFRVGMCLFDPNSIQPPIVKEALKTLACGIVVVSMAGIVFDVIDEKDVVANNSTISGLVSAGRLCLAESLFDGMPQRDEVSQITILDGYVKAGKMNEVFSLLRGCHCWKMSKAFALFKVCNCSKDE